MKKILLILILFPIIGISQKKNNGKVFDKHPAIDIAEKFNKAYEQGDIAILKSLVSKDFKMWTLTQQEVGDHYLLGNCKFLFC